MNGTVAILLCFVGVAFLFYLDRDKSVQSSNALWLPTLWIGIAGSRGVSEWIGMGPPEGLQGTLDGSPVDAAVFGVLMAIGIFVLLGRRRKTSAYLAVIVPIIVYSVYCFISVSWSPYPLPAVKRWIKDVGDVVMVLIVVTDPQPLNALRRLFSRIGFILLPFSIVLIRYTTIGRAWDDDGNLAIVGVTTNKNMLGLIAYLLSLGALWNFRWFFMNKGEPNRNRRLAAQGILLASGIYLLVLAHSSTSLACFLLGSGLLLATHLRIIRQRPAAVHVLCLAIVLAGGSALAFGGLGDVAGALGRDSSLSGRTFMWSAMIGAVSNPIIGVGFDSFWTSPNAEAFHHTLDLLHWYHAGQINEAHNGYLEIFLNLGWIGVCLIAVILLTGYIRASNALRRHRELGSMMLAYIMSIAVYSITEAGFRTLSPIWILLLLAIVGASGVNAGLLHSQKPQAYRSAKAKRMSSRQELEPERAASYVSERAANTPSARWAEYTSSVRGPRPNR